MCSTSKKRKHFPTIIDESSKKIRLEVSNSLKNDSIQDPSNEDYNCNEISLCRNYYPSHLIKLMYQLDFSVLCLLRKLTYEPKYPSLKILFEVSEFDKFNDVVLRYKDKCVCIQIDNSVNQFMINDINYTDLFTKGKGSLNNYFNNFVKQSILKPYSLLSKAEYLIIFTNSGLDLSKENTLKNSRNRNFYPFKFDSMDLEENTFLNDILITKRHPKAFDYYQFSKDEIVKEELLKRLQFSPVVRKVIGSRQFSEGFKKEMKTKFLDRLVFAVNQPNRAEIKSIIKTEAKQIKYDYPNLQNRILSNLTSKKLGSKIAYEFNVLLSNLNDMVLNKKISAINLTNSGTSNIITLYYKNKVTYIKVVNESSYIDYSILFPPIKEEANSNLSINKHFSFFIEKVRKGINIKFFVLFTNVSLDLTLNNILRRGCSIDFNIIKFDNVNVEKSRYKILRECSCIDIKELYQFSQEDGMNEKIINLLRIPCALQKEKEQGKLSDESEREMKQIFLHKLVFAVNQSNKVKLNSLIVDKIEKGYSLNKIQYNYEELHEVTLRWLEFHEFDAATEKVINKILNDIKLDSFSFLNIKYKNIKEEINFTKAIIDSSAKLLTFHQFVNFIIKGEGKHYLEVIKRNGIKLRSISNILHRANNPLQAFKNLYKVLFDENGFKTKYVKNLENNNIKFSTISCALHGSGISAAEAFQNLHDLWFDDEGNKTHLTETIQKYGIKLQTFSNLISQSGSNAPKVFKDLYDLFFDEKGNKTEFMQNLEKEKINVTSMSNIIVKSGLRAVKSFKKLYDVFIDKEGKKTEYLQLLDKNQIALSTLSSILSQSGYDAADSFTKLLKLWFDDQGNKTRYLSVLDDHGINMVVMSSILHNSNKHAAKVYKELIDLWFDKQGNKTEQLKMFENNGINITDIAKLLREKNIHAPKTFNTLYDLLFGNNRNKTQNFMYGKERGVNLANTIQILSGSSSSVAIAFKNLYDF